MFPILQLSFGVMTFAAFSNCAALPQATISSTSPLPQVTPVHKFLNGTWVENLAIRSNGGIVVSILSSPEVLYLDPSDNFETATTVATFPAPATGVLGIAEMEPEIFYVAANSYDFSAQQPFTNGTGSVWRIDLSEYAERKDSPLPVREIARFPQSGTLNGVTSIPEKKLLLIADSTMGVVWRLNVRTKVIDVAINNTFTQVNQTAKSAGLGLGANGVHIKDGFAYLTNSGSDLYARVPIDDSGLATGPGQILTQGLLGFPDDFALGNGEEAYVADGVSNSVLYTSGHEDVRAVASVEGPTSIQYGRVGNDTKALYIASTGNDLAYDKPPVNVGGAIFKLELV